MKIFLLSSTKKVLAFLSVILILNLFPSGKLFSQSRKIYAIPIAVPSANYVSQSDGHKVESPAELSSAEDSKLTNSSDENADHLLAAPANDACATATNVANTLLPGGNYKCGTLQAATVEAGEYTGCFAPAPSGTVWYSFIADQPTMWICVTPTNAVCNPSFGIAVYQASTCFPGLGARVGCLNYFPATGTNLLSKVNLAGLTVGAMYMVQVAISSAGCAGNTWKPFCIKIGHPTTCTTCANICGPMCVMAGAGWAPPPLCCTVGQVNQITSTCPSYPLGPPMNLGDSQTSCYSFTAVNDTVWLQQIVYSYCNPQTLTFTYNLYTSGCGLIQSGNVFANSQIINLTVGQTYRICYSLTAACSWDSVVWPFAYTGTSSLPVEMVSFGAMTLSEKVKLYWTTASEENCKEYIIEKSLNANDFTEIGRVKGAGNSNIVLNYKAYDSSPKEGINYYRLKQIDNNGKFSYTKLVAARFSANAADLSIIPNPATDKVMISFNAAGKYEALLKVINVQGKIVSIEQFNSVEGINEYSLNMNELAKGIYTVQLIVDDQNMISRLVKE
jgi:hypothetical protein